MKVNGTLLHEALTQAEHSPVFPCKANKKPATEHGFKDASNDAERVREMFGRPGAELVAVPTGEISGLVVIDVDPEGVAWLDENRHRLPKTREHLTKRGRHVLFKYSKGTGLKCSTNRPVSGIDVRTDGGYIVWWPAHGLAVENPETIADLPAWLLAELTGPEQPRNYSERIPAGATNTTLSREAMGWMNQLRGKTDLVRALVIHANLTRADRPVSATEIETIVESARKKWAQDHTEPDAEPEPFPTNLVLGVGAFIKLELPPPEPIIEGLIGKQHVVEIVGWRGVGKTWVGMFMALQVARAQPFLGFAVPVPLRVLYVDGEMAANEIQERCRSLLGHNSPPDNFMVMSSEVLRRETDGTVIINNDVHQYRFELMLEALKADGRAPAMIIFDNLSALTDGIDEDKSTDFKSTGQWFVRLRQLGYTVVFFHHTGKSGDQRGTSGHEDFVNTTFKLIPPDQGPTSPTQFTFAVDKFRSAARPSPDRIGVTLVADEHGVLALATEIKPGVGSNLHHVHDLILKHVHVTGGRVSRKSTAAALAKAHSTIRTHVTALVRRRLLASDAHGWLTVTERGMERLRQVYPDEVPSNDY